MLIKCRRSKSAQGLHLLDELLCDGLAGGLFWDLARQGVPAATFQALADELAKVSERKWLPRWTEALGLGRSQEQQTPEALTHHEQSARQHLAALVRGLRGLAWAVADDPLPPAEPQWLLWRRLLRGETGPACRVPLAVVDLAGGGGRLLWLHGMALPSDPADTNPGIVGEHPRQLGRVWLDCGEQSATFHPAVVTSFAEAADPALGPIPPGQHGLYWVEPVTAQEVEAATPEALRPPDWTFRRERLREEAQGPLLLQGPSCGGAALRLWAHVRRGLYPDEGVLVLAQWKEAGLVGFRNVQDVQAKSDAAGRCGAMVDTLVFVAGPEDARPARLESLQLWPLDSGTSSATRRGLVQQRSLRAEALETYLKYVGQLWAWDGMHLRPHHVGDVRAPGGFLSEEQRVALNDSPWLEGGHADPRTGDLLIPPHLTQRFKRGSSEEEGKRIRHPGSIEELKPEDRLRTEPAEWVVGRQARVLIVGEAGLGKTTALRLLAARSARASLKQLQASTRPLGELEVPLLTTVNRVLDHKSLAAALREDLKGLKLAWSEHCGDRLTVLQGSRPWLLLDSVDEAGHHAREFVQAIKDEIQHLARVVLTTRAETEPHLLETIGWAEEARWEIAPSDWLGWTGYVTAWFGPGSPKAKSLVHTLATGLLQAHQNPLLLTLAVQAHQDTDLSADTTPAELYDRCVAKLIQGKWRKDLEAELTPTLAGLPRYRESLEEQAIRTLNPLHRQQLKQQLDWPDEDLLEKWQLEFSTNHITLIETLGKRRDALERARKQAPEILPAIAWELFGADASGRAFLEERFVAAARAQRLLNYEPDHLLVVLKQCGLVEASGDDLIWPHRSFVAYFAARHLATLLEAHQGQGFATQVTLDLSREPYVRVVTGETARWTGPISDLLRIVRWMPVWEPFLQFLAGHLTQPLTATQLLELIWEPSIKPAQIECKRDLFASVRILTANLTVHLKAGIRRADVKVLKLTREWIDRMVHRLRDPHAGERPHEQTIETLNSIGLGLMAHPEAVQALARILLDLKAIELTREAAIYGIEGSGQWWSTQPKALRALFLDGWVRPRVSLGPVWLRHPEAVQALVQVATDSQSSCKSRAGAIHLLAKLGPAVGAYPEAHRVLVQLVMASKADATIRDELLNALLSLGPALPVESEASRAMANGAKCSEMEFMMLLEPGDGIFLEPRLQTRGSFTWDPAFLLRDWEFWLRAPELSVPARKSAPSAGLKTSPF